MSSSPTPAHNPVPESVAASNRALAYSLVWGGVMMFILGWWLGVKHEELSRLVVFAFWFLAALSFVGGAWQFRTLASPFVSPEFRDALLARQRKVLGTGLLVGGVILLGLAVYLGITFKLLAFGEVVGSWLVASAAILCGWRLSRGGPQEMDSYPLIDSLRRQHAPVGLFMIGLGMVLVITPVALVFLQTVSQDWLPEMICLFLFGFLAFLAGMRLAFTPTTELTTAKLRLFVLVVGGLAGLILAVGAWRVPWPGVTKYSVA